MEVYSKEEKDKLIKELEKKHKEILEKKLKEIESEYKNKKYQEELEKKLYEKEKENKTEKYKEEIEKKLKELQEKQETTKYQEEIEKKLKELETKKDKNCNSDSNCCQELLKSIKNSKENHPMNLECFKESKIWNRKLKEIEDNLKIAENKNKKEIEDYKKETDKKIKELISQIKKEEWIIGEYKWMPTGSTMPEGWVKVDLPKGYTIVQGIEKGITKGNVGSHNHYYGDNNSKYALITEKNWTEEDLTHTYFTSYNEGNPVNDKYVIYWTKQMRLNYSNTSSQGDNLNKNQDNLAAGIFGELWQYQGIKKENDDTDYICCKKIK